MKRSVRSGFTLVEIMVVVIIIGVLAALIVPSLFSRTGKAKVSVAKQQVATLDSAVQMFQQDYGRFPESLQELVTPPADVEGAAPPSGQAQGRDRPVGQRVCVPLPRRQLGVQHHQPRGRRARGRRGRGGGYQ